MNFYLDRAFFLLWLLPGYILARWLWLRMKKTAPGRAREILLAVFVLFSALLLELVFDLANGLPDFSEALRAAISRLRHGTGINLIPFRTVSAYWVGDPFSPAFLINIVGNVVMFIPIGFFPRLLFRRFRPVWKTLLLAVAAPAFIESVQLLLWRSVDIDDLLLNAAGILLGRLIAAVLLGLSSSARKLPR